MNTQGWRTGRWWKFRRSRVRGRQAVVPKPLKSQTPAMEMDSVKLFFLSHQLRPTLVCLKVKSETNILLDKYLLQLEPQIWDMLTEHWLFGCGSKIPSATTVLYNVWDIPHQTSQNHLLAWPCSQVVSPQCQPKFKNPGTSGPIKPNIKHVSNQKQQTWEMLSINCRSQWQTFFCKHPVVWTTHC